MTSKINKLHFIHLCPISVSHNECTYSVFHEEKFSSTAFMQNEGNVLETVFGKEESTLISVQVKQFKCFKVGLLFSFGYNFTCVNLSKTKTK